MRFDLRSQLILNQLRNLYATAEVSKQDYLKHRDTFIFYKGSYNYVYDFLIEEGHEINYSQEEKKLMYSLAKKKFVKEHQSWIDKLGKCEFNDKKLADTYKSVLARRYLLDRYFEDGAKLLIHDEQGNNLKPITYMRLNLLQPNEHLH